MPTGATAVGEIDFTGFDAITFDCYGTLIDWERGILDALQPVLAPHGVDAGDDELLECYGRHEAALEAGDYLPYREILARSLRGLCDAFGIHASDEDVSGFAQSVGAWPAFRDSAAALRRLAGRFRLGVITNCDDDLFALSNRRLGVTFDWVVTAERARCYKPGLETFAVAFEMIDVPRERILHAAQSLFHDHVPAKQLGLTTVWIDRRHGRRGFGATPEATATPDLTVPDMTTFADLALARAAGAA
jgi:2-haloacid dehalogenase